MTLPEILLWQALRGKALGSRFRKQHPAGDYILDFYCPAARLAIEVDGQGHATPEQIDHDRRRDAWLTGHTVRTLRIPAAAILSDLPDVIAAIAAAIASNQPLHQPAAGPPPRSGEE